MKKVNLEDYVIGYSVIGHEEKEGGMDIHHHGEWMEDLSEAIAVLEDAEKNHKINNCDWTLAVDVRKKPCRGPG